MKNTFFTQKNCDRCGNDLAIRTMSWFTTETICWECSKKEQDIKDKLIENGKDWEGCGYIPKVK